MDDSSAWLLSVLASGALGAWLVVMWRHFKGGGRVARQRQARAAESVPLGPSPVGGIVRGPAEHGWVNCDCMAEAIMPTVYDQVVVVAAVEYEPGGGVHPDYRPGLRCRACGRTYLQPEMFERAKTMGVASREGGPGVAGRGIEPR